MPDYVVDFERCVGVDELKQTLAEINGSPRYVLKPQPRTGRFIRCSSGGIGMARVYYPRQDLRETTESYYPNVVFREVDELVYRIVSPSTVCPSPCRILRRCGYRPGDAIWDYASHPMLGFSHSVSPCGKHPTKEEYLQFRYDVWMTVDFLMRRGYQVIAIGLCRDGVFVFGGGAV